MTDGTKILLGLIIFSIAIIISSCIISQGIMQGLHNCGNNIGTGYDEGLLQLAFRIEDLIEIISSK